MNIVFRTDASSEIGTGHVMRCLTLAQRLRKDEVVCTFVCREHDGHYIEHIRNQHFKVLALPKRLNKQKKGKLQHASWLVCDQQTDAKETREAIQGINPEWLIVDHYGIDKEWEESLRDVYKKLMVIDDLADRTHCCDLLLDQNLICDTKTPYINLVPGYCKQLFGPAYALLRQEFITNRAFVRQVKSVSSIFVFFGGVDSTNLTELFLNSIASEELKHLTAEVVVGINNNHVDSIEKASATNSNVTLHSGIDNIAEVMIKADVAIGTCGSSTWERMCMGLASLTVIGGENEQHIADELASLDLIDVVGSALEITMPLLKNKIMEFTTNIDRIQTQQCKILKAVDGLGVERVVEQLL